MATGRLIDRLVKSARLDPVLKMVELSTGDIVEMYVKPLTAAERDRAKKDARSDDPTAFALQLLVRKALDENGTPLFTVGDIPTLKNEIRDADLQALMLAVIGVDEEEPLDMKSSS
jgi:hypothetical protein